VLGGIGILWERWGRLKWPEIITPALELLEAGMPYGATADAIRMKEPLLRRFEASARHLMPHYKLPAAADVWHRPDMEKTLRRLATAGWRDFYEGELGRRIADHVATLGGILTRADMARFTPRVTEPYTGLYRGAPVYSAVLPNGGLSSLEILHMLDSLDRVADTSPVYWHRFAEVLKLAWRDRLLYLGDPQSARVPVERLLSRDYAAGRAETLRQFPDHVDRLQPPLPLASPAGTLHVATGDAAGNLVAVTISHGGFFGSCVTVPGTGVTLGHGMCRFDPHPGLPNSVGPGKRPLNNVSPLVVRLPGRDVALGLRGGRRIVNASAQLAARVVDYGVPFAEAAAAPRLHAQAKEPIEVSPGVAPEIVDRLRALGHEVKTAADLVMGAHGAEFLKGPRQVRAGGNVAAVGVSWSEFTPP
jgi:gamma-glutamyltranspeptidase/glutathione hydrolase